MELAPEQKQALARWHELGTTTPTHPVLQMAYDLYLAPMGIVCDALSYDALAIFENPQAQITLVEPRFDAQKADRQWGQFSIIEPLLGMTGLVTPRFNSSGVIEEFSIEKDFAFTDENNSMMATFVQSSEYKKIQDFEAKYAPAIFELSDTVVETAKLYIDASLHLMVQSDATSLELAKTFVENPRQYATLAFQVFKEQGNS